MFKMRNLPDVRAKSQIHSILLTAELDGERGSAP